ncbi:Rv3654c family TadE-like protein [Propionibacteriaceae bacterium Y1923]|uniref:Rv3654c family TadE-like protein n=1 Tax=Aestuariimicrobium sp. Y1814 TaxID=3418742 RepID=UPI003C1F9B19
MSGTLALGLVGFMLLGLWAIGWIASAHRAHRIADLAALTGAHTLTQGGDPCAAARETARRNGGEVTTCTLKGDAVSFVLLVEASTPLRPAITLPGVPRRAWGAAAAGPAGSP